MSYATSPWFVERLDRLTQSSDVKAYVVGVLNKFVVTTQDDMSTESVVLEFFKAHQLGDFARIQRIADWSLWIASFSPQYQHIETILTLGQSSYDVCYRMMNWDVYRQLATHLPSIASEVNRATFTSYTLGKIVLTV